MRFIPKVTAREHRDSGVNRACFPPLVHIAVDARGHQTQNVHGRVTSSWSVVHNGDFAPPRRARLFVLRSTSVQPSFVFGRRRRLEGTEIAQLVDKRHPPKGPVACRPASGAAVPALIPLPAATLAPNPAPGPRPRMSPRITISAQVQVQAQAWLSPGLGVQVRGVQRCGCPNSTGGCWLWSPCSRPG